MFVIRLKFTKLFLLPKSQLRLKPTKEPAYPNAPQTETK